MLSQIASVSFADMGKERTTKTKQVGQRIPEGVYDRLMNFSIQHPFQPSFAKLLERAITEFLDREEPKLSPSKPAPGKGK